MDSLYKCVWMTAGVLTYRLCDRDYDCEHCIVDQAMREAKPGGVEPAGRRGTTGGAGMEASSELERESLRLMPGWFYHPTHQIVQIVGGGVARIGFDPLLAHLLGSIRRFRLPKQGMLLHRSQVAWRVNCEAGRVELPSPISGRVIQINEATSHDFGTDPAEGAWLGGWLLEIRPSRLRADLSRLLYGAKARAWWQTELEKVRDHLVDLRLLESGTFPDGGQLDPGTLARLTPTVRERLLEHLVRRQISGRKRSLSQ